MTRHTATDAPPHVHLQDATNHLANARRSLEAASPADPDLAKIVRHLELYVRRLGREVARAERNGSVRNRGQIEAAAGAAASMHEDEIERGER